MHVIQAQRREQDTSFCIDVLRTCSPDRLDITDKRVEPSPFSQGGRRPGGESVTTSPAGLPTSGSTKLIEISGDGSVPNTQRPSLRVARANPKGDV